jgi:hypothetical protein
VAGSQNNTVIVSSNGKSRRGSANPFGNLTGSSKGRDDGSSEKSILTDEQWANASPAAGKIMRRQDIVVEYRERRDTEAQDFEMAHIPG